ncbi:MAG: ABC transporter permease, partial [Dehalococcoidales bacterium]|nr:ABC transporter permease [Dehalococcoidales bacterium]
ASLVTGISFIIAAISKSFMSVLALGMLILIILFIPTFGVMFPGVASGWVKAIPSYYLVDTIHRASNFGVGWGDMWYNLVILMGFDLVLTWIGIVVLRRKYR